MRLQLTRRRGLHSAFGALALAVALLVLAIRDARAQVPAASNDSTLTEHFTAGYGQYVDTDHVFVETPSVSAAVSNPAAGWSVGGEYLADVISAASVDVVSTASQNWKEVRQEGNVAASYKPRTFGVQASGRVSDEPDYLSWTAGGAITQDVMDKDVTWLVGYAHSHDIAGRTGTPFSVFSEALNRDAFNGSLTLVVNPKTIASFIVDGIFENGDQSKPYRYIPLFAPGTYVPRGAPIDLVNSLRVSARPLEQLPLSRQRYALTGRVAHRDHLATLRLDERLYADSWLMKATTTDARYLFDLSDRVEIGPHVRVHAQTSVNFWQRAYVLEPGFQYPAFRTGDRELGPLLNFTGGGTLRLGVGPNANPTSWVLAFDLDATYTQFLDDLYLTRRFSNLGVFTLETDL